MIKNLFILLLGFFIGIYIFPKYYPHLLIKLTGNTVFKVVSTKVDDAIPFNKEITGTRLDLSSKGLDKLPSYILSKSDLEELNISNNSITGALPSEISKLKNLKILNASNNKMTGVPAEVGQLDSLEILNLSNNNLTGLPYELGNLKKLKTLDLSGNNVSKVDLDIIKSKLNSSVTIIQ